MANRRKDVEAAIKFSVETSTPAASTPKPAKKTRPTSPVTASEVLPGLRKAQREATVPVHPRAAADRVKRTAEIAAGIDEARMPKQDEAEARWKSDRVKYTDADRAAFAARQEEKRKADLEAYKSAPVSDAEKMSAKKMQLPKKKFGRGRR